MSLYAPTQPTIPVMRKLQLLLLNRGAFFFSFAQLQTAKKESAPGLGL